MADGRKHISTDTISRLTRVAFVIIAMAAVTTAALAGTKPGQVVGTWRGFRTVGIMLYHHRITVPSNDPAHARGVAWSGISEKQADAFLASDYSSLQQDPLLTTGYCVIQRYQVSSEGGKVTFKSAGIDKIVAVMPDRAVAVSYADKGSMVVQSDVANPRLGQATIVWAKGSDAVSDKGQIDDFLKYHASAMPFYRPDVFVGTLISPGIIAKDATAEESGGSTDFLWDRRFNGKSLFRLWKDGTLDKPLPLKLAKGTVLKLGCLDGTKYHYTCYIPRGYDPAKPTAVLINMSPSGKGKPLSTRMAEKLRWLMVGLTEAKDGPWQAACENRDAVIFDLRRRFNIDTRRLYFSGWSGGGAASVVGAVNWPENCAGVLLVGPGCYRETLSRHIPVFVMAGDKDYLKSNADDLHKESIAHGRPVKLTIFRGKHSWGPKADLEAGIQWLADQTAKTQ